MQPIRVDVAIIGAGTAGLYALREVRRAGKSFVLIDSGPLGTTCARVGCMPSKVALHAAELWRLRGEQQRFGIAGTEQLQLNRTLAWQQVRAMRDNFAARGTASAQNAAGEHLLLGRARFVAPGELRVSTAAGERLVQAAAVVIATGSSPVMPGFLQPFADFCLTTDDLFELQELPQRLGILGLGAIGLEMGLAMTRLGVQVFGADMAATVAGISDPEVSSCALEIFGREMQLYLGAPAQLAAAEQGVMLQAGQEQVQVDQVLVALGRRPNLATLELANAGVELDERGLPDFDPHSMQLRGQRIFIAGDATGQRTLMHEAADEGAMAGFNACREQQVQFRRKSWLAIAFSQPDVIAVGASFAELQEQQLLIGTAWTDANGRSRILSSDKGVLRIYAAPDGKLLGAAMIGPRAEHVAQLLALALERDETAASLLQMPFYHPVVEEMVQSALQDIVRQQGGAGELPPGLQSV